MLKIKSLIMFLAGFMLLCWSVSFASAAGTSAKLDVNIDWPNEMYFHKPLQGVVTQAHSATGGSASTQASSAARDQDEKDADIQKLQTFGINYKQIVIDSFEKELISKGVYDAASPNNLELDVVMYGYSHKGGFNINMVPMLKVKVQLMDANGKRLFKGTGSVSVFGTPVAKAEYYDLLESKQLAESLFLAAAEKVAQNALKKYK